MALSRTIVAGLLVAVLSGAAGAATVEEGQLAYDAGRYEDALRIWTELAQTGDPAAETGLGMLYDVGKGVPQDAVQAYGWYRRAAGAGMARAQFNVAVMLDSGVGVGRDRAQAATWYAKAAARGHARAQYNLAQLYASGEGVPRNVAQAKSWYRAAAAGGLTAASERLASLDRADQGQAAGATDNRLVPVRAVAPAGDIQVAGTGAELVWLAPPQPKAVRYFVQLLVAEGTGWRELSGEYVAGSAALVQLDPAATRYAWRAYAVAEGDSHYAAGEWSQFIVSE